jgi:HSP20 family protein
MYLVKRNPRLDWTPQHIDRFFRDFWNSSPFNWDDDSIVWSPRVDVKETKEAYEVLADLPGLNKKDISISLHNNVLTVEGERKSEAKSEDENSYYQERTYGSFSRSFQLPSKVEQKNIQAEYKDGVLKVILHKSEEAKPREIEIK